ncbi:MAG TPA: cbb3-type cytochrome c oxidase subunit I [Phycisphaerales bacterium]|nr:cbb3-type cytochrome c oxidase subunit I [Phycisphaerales bacterium]
MSHAAHDHHASYLAYKGSPDDPFWSVKLPRTIWDWASTIDHKKIGVMYLVAILFMFFLGGMAAIAVRTELWAPTKVQTINDATGEVIVGAVPAGVKSHTEVRGNWIGHRMGEGENLAKSNELYNRTMTLHGVIMVFLVIVPSVPASLGNFLLPLMLGAKDVAFPRLNLASWYVYLVGSVFAIIAIIQGGVDTGWTFYTPYSTTTDDGFLRVTWMVTGAFILGFSSIFTGLNFVVTVHKLRAPGMGWFDMPLFVWGIYGAAVIQVLATPVIGITLLLMIFERTFHVGIFDPRLGGDPVLFQHFFWFYSHPVVYVMILPGMALMNEMIATGARKPIFGYRAVAFSSLAIAGISFIVWGHHLFTSEGEVAAIVFSALTFLVAIPSAVKVFNWLATLYKGSICLNTWNLYALAFLFLFSIGGLTGLFLGSLAVDLHLHDTYFVVSHFHYVMMGGTIIAFVGGIHFWWPKMFGKMYNEVGGTIGFVLVFIGFNLTFFPQFVMGSQGMPRRYANYVSEYQLYHQLSTIGAYTLLAGFLTHLVNFLYSLAAGPKAAPNPWGSLTLDWTNTSSPPIEHNFEHEPVVVHGPYDYDNVLPPQTRPGDYILPKPADVATGH